MSSTPSAYGAWLSSVRASLGWSTEHLATMSRAPRVVIEQLESGGIQNPDRSVREKIEPAIQAGVIEAQRRAAGEAVPQSETMVRVYETVDRYSRDVALLTQQGWQIASQTEARKGRGCLTFFAAPRTIRTVTYQRTLTSGEGAPLTRP